MPRNESGLPGESETALRFEDPKDRKARRHQRRLGIFGQGKVGFRSFEHEF